MKYAILGGKYRFFLENALNSLNLVPIWLPDNTDVDERLSGHADLSLLYDGKNRILVAPFLKNHPEFLEKMQNIGIFTEFIGKQGGGYPRDAGLNILVCGDVAVCNKKTADASALEMLSGHHLIQVKQGYTNCAVCKVTDRAVITADRGIAVKLQEQGFDVLLIDQGHIRLDGFDYGFIGGAAFIIEEGKLAFTGSPDKHPDAERIYAFLKKYSVELILLSDESIFDIGGAIILNVLAC